MNDRQAILSARLRAARDVSPKVQAAMPAPASTVVTLPHKDYLRLADVATELGVHPRTVAAWEKQGLRICPVGRITVIRRADLDEFIVRHGGSVPNGHLESGDKN